jgi:hypothetical protein
MTYPPQQPHQPPVMPGPSYQPPPAQPAPQAPSGPSRQTTWIVVAAVAGVAFVSLIAAAVLGVVHPGGGSSKNFTVSVTSCAADTIGIGKVGLSVTNLTSQTRTATIEIEYRDGTGSRLDSDTARVRDIRPGDTARADETTILDGTPSGSLICIIKHVS